MAGTTLRGIGEDEAEEGEDEQTPPPPNPQSEADFLSGPTVVDDAKVAESLRKLRSLEEYPATPPPTVIPSGNAPPATSGSLEGPLSTTTLLGVSLTLPSRQAPPPPAMGTGTLFGIGTPSLKPPPPPAQPSVSQTLSGVVAPVDTENDATIPTNSVSGVIEPDVRGTMLGRDLHIADRLPPEGARMDRAPITGEFSGGERHFFESEPISTDYEPEFKPNPYARVGVAMAVFGVFVAAVWGYVRYRRFEPPPIEAQTAPAPVETPAPAATPPAPIQPPPSAITGQEPPAPAAAQAEPIAPVSSPAAPSEAPVPPSAEPPPAPQASAPPAETIKEPKEPKEAPESQTAPAEKPRSRPAISDDKPKTQREREAALATPSFAASPSATSRRPARPSASLEPARPAVTSKPAMAPREPPFASSVTKPAVRSPPPVLPGQTIPVPPRPKNKRLDDDPDGTLPLSTD